MDKILLDLRRYAFARQSERVFLDPEDCGCTDCIHGEAVHPSSLSAEQVIDLLHGRVELINRSSGHLTFELEAHGHGYHDVHLVNPWTGVRTGVSWMITDADLSVPLNLLALSYDVEGMIVG